MVVGPVRQARWEPDPCAAGDRARAYPVEIPVKENQMLELIIVVLLVLWLIGYFGPARFPSIPNSGGFIHVLLVIVLVLIVLRLL
jgi:hypothetical protein